MTEDELVETPKNLIAGTLDWCNKRRAEQGQEPLTELPVGRRMDPETCPCGEATGLYVEKFLASESKQAWACGEGESLPYVVRCFIHAFDRGEIPELDVEAA